MELLLICAAGCLSCVLLASWQASVLVGLVLLVRVLLGDLLPPRGRYLLWGIVLARLLVPVFPASDFSVFNLAAGLTESTNMKPAASTSGERAVSAEPARDGGRSQPSLAQVSVTTIQPNEPAPVDSDSGEPKSSPVVVPALPSAEAGTGDTTSRWLRSSDWVVLIWLSGVAWLALRLLLGCRRLGRIMAAGTVVRDSRTLELFEQCRRKAGVTKPVTLWSIGGEMTPAVTGLWRPKILIPDQVLNSFTEEELRFVLLHELIHVRRHDVAVNWLAWLVQTLHWFNPVIWFAVRRLRYDRELACDALVLERTGESAAARYGHTAIKLLGLFSDARSVPAAVGILDRKRSVVRRIAMIGRYRKPSRLQNSVAILIVLLLAGVGLTDAAPDVEKPDGEQASGQEESASSSVPKPVAADTGKTEERSTGVSEEESERIRFVDVTAESGLDAFSGGAAAKDTPRAAHIGSGCAFIDFDNDGDLDIVLVNMQPSNPEDDEKGEPKDNSIRLLENNGHGQFKDVTPKEPCWSGLSATGIAVGDFDNDGLPDLFVAAIGLNRLLRNLGQGKFEDVTLQAGVAGGVDVWSTGCGWVDIDRDGDLDLFVVAYSAQKERKKEKAKTAAPSLFLNQGNGRFVEKAKLNSAATGASLGVTFADVDADGWLDIFVANDGFPNNLFRNQNGQTFQDIGLMSGVALAADGTVTSSTGIDFGTLEDGRSGLLVGSGAMESAGLFVGAGDVLIDQSKSMGIATGTLEAATFGTGWLDADLDGVQDIFLLNGAVDGVELKAPAGPELLLRVRDNARPTRIQIDIESDAGTVTPPFNGRGAAFGDIDGDGDVDVLISTLDTPRLLRNENPSKNRWLRFKLIGKRTNRDAIGSRVTIEVASGARQTRQVMPTRGYLSQSELAVTFGLGRADSVRRVIIDWADGSQSEFSNVAANQTLVVEQREVFRPLVGVVTDITLKGQPVQKGDLLTEIEAAAEETLDTKSKGKPSAVVQVDLLDRPEGTLRAIRIDGKDLGSGEKAFTKLAEAIRQWAVTPGRPALAEREVEIRVSSGLKHEYVVRAISVCSGRTNPETGKSERYVSRIRFSPSRPIEALQLSIGFVRSKGGKRLSKNPVVLWDDRVVPLDRVGVKVAEWIKSTKVPAKKISVTLEGDSDVPTDSIQELIHTLQKQGFERFSLRAVDSADADLSDKENSSNERRFDHVPAPDPKQLEAMIRDIFSNKSGSVVFSDPQTGELVISAEDRQTLDRVESLLKELAKQKEKDSREAN